MFQYLIGIILVFIVLSGLFFASKSLRKKRLANSLNLKLLLVKLPQQHSSDDEKKVFDWKEEINTSSQLFSILAGLKSFVGFEVAVNRVGEEINFYVAVPSESLEFVSRQIEGLWKDSQVSPIGDYNIFNSFGTSFGAYIKQKHSYALPIRTYLEANIDTFSPILSGFSKINETNEGVALQILMKPAPESIKKNIFQMIINLKKGMRFDEIFKAGVLKDVNKLFTPEKKEEEKKEKIIDEEAIKLLGTKISKPLLSVNARILVSALNQKRADEIFESVSGAFSGFGAPDRQEIKIIRPKNPKNIIYEFSFREFNNEEAVILNSEELASIFHFPSSTTNIPKINWLKSKETAPPINLPDSGVLIGESNFRGEKKKIYISDDDRRRHVYTVGQTGTGKSNLMTNMAIDDIKRGKGVAVIDPHGDLIEKILSLIPENRVNDVIIFDPSDRQRPLGMNMLEYDLNKPEEKTFIVNELFSILDKLYDMKTVGGPMFEQYTKNAILLLMEDMANEQATLIEIPRIFTDSEFRNRKLERIKNPIVIDFWQKEAIKATGEHSLANMAPYITSKFNNFIANDYVRPIIGQFKSAFNFRQAMDKEKIILVNLSKGKIGDINASLLGMIIVGKILMAALSRVDIPEDERKDFNLYIDEFQNFTTDSIATILSEARKYRLNLTIGHQFIAQLTEKIRDAVFGNVGNIISFRVGAQDAEFLKKQFEPVFNERDLLGIDNFNSYVKFLVNGQTTKPFNIKTTPPLKGNFESAEIIKENSKLKYGRDFSEVEEEIFKRLRV